MLTAPPLPSAEKGGVLQPALFSRNIEHLPYLDVPRLELVDLHQSRLAHPMFLGEPGETLTTGDHVADHVGLVVALHAGYRRTRLLGCDLVGLITPAPEALPTLLTGAPPSPTR